MTNDKTRLRIRMYRQGLGDCFLLTFNPDEQPVHLLIDCGTLGNGGSTVTMQRVVDDIAATTQRHLGLLIATHEHRDHLSGFNTGRAVFDDHFTVDQVWVAWTENPDDPVAQQIVRYKKDLLSSLRFASQKLQNNGLSGAEQTALAATGARIGALLDFDADLPPEEMVLGVALATSVNDAMNYATSRAGRPPDFLEPGQVLEPAWLPGVRFYVLGPPCSPQALSLLGDRDSPELYHFSELQAASLAATMPFHAAAGPLADYRRQLDGEARQRFEAGQPFDDRFRIDASEEAACQGFYPNYFAQAEVWRRIDLDWLSSADDLALQLNSMTNNTSLVLAIELIEDGRVILMAADAQLGNWQSWDKLTFDVTGADGAARTGDDRGPIETDGVLQGRAPRQHQWHAASRLGSHGASGLAGDDRGE